jgi:hypothetical protein
VRCGGVCGNVEWCDVAALCVLTLGCSRVRVLRCGARGVMWYGACDYAMRWI